jgi:hypothetical protein
LEDLESYYRKEVLSEIEDAIRDIKEGSVFNKFTKMGKRSLNGGDDEQEGMLQ